MKASWVLGIAGVAVVGFFVYEHMKKTDVAKASGGPPPPKPGGSPKSGAGFLSSLDPTTSAAQRGEGLGGALNKLGAGALKSLFS